MLLNVRPEHVPLLKAALDLALRAASGYSVRTCPERDTISAHWEDFAVLVARVNALEEQRELGMTRKLATGRHYIHFSIDEKVYERLYAYLLKVGGGRIRQGNLGHFAERAISEMLDDLEKLEGLVIDEGFDDLKTGT